jgi:hypothetical protein
MNAARPFPSSGCGAVPCGAALRCSCDPGFESGKDEPSEQHQQQPATAASPAGGRGGACGDAASPKKKKKKKKSLAATSRKTRQQTGEARAAGPLHLFEQLSLGGRPQQKAHVLRSKSEGKKGSAWMRGRAHLLISSCHDSRPCRATSRRPSRSAKAAAPTASLGLEQRAGLLDLLARSRRLSRRKSKLEVASHCGCSSTP